MHGMRDAPRLCRKTHVTDKHYPLEAARLPRAHLRAWAVGMAGANFSIYIFIARTLSHESAQFCSTSVADCTSSKIVIHKCRGRRNVSPVFAHTASGIAGFSSSEEFAAISKEKISQQQMLCSAAERSFPSRLLRTLRKS